MSVADIDAGVSEDAFLDGRVMLRQPRKGYRAGLDALMLAASVPAAAGERLVEAGCGAGAAALCLAARVEGVHVTGVDIDAAALALARENAARNGLHDRLSVHEADLSRPGQAMRAAGLVQASFAHAFANPPYHPEDSVRAPRDAARARAHLRGADLLDCWMRFLAGLTRPGGTITMILPGDAVGEALELFAGRAGKVRIFPLFPRKGAPAHRIIVQGTKGVRARPRLLQGLVLHDEGNGYREQMDRYLRRGEALELP